MHVVGTNRNDTDSASRTVLAEQEDAALVRSCGLCGHGPLESFLTVHAVPVHVGVLWPSAEAARSCAKGDLDLGLCPSCGFVSNVAFDPERIDYGQKYDDALHASPFFQQFERDLATHLVRIRTAAAPTNPKDIQARWDSSVDRHNH